MYGQTEVDRRGVVAPDEAANIRRLRSAEQWERYDSIVIGAGANNVDDGWFNTWAAFGAAVRVTFFGRRNQQVGMAYSNSATERMDWAQDIWQSGAEFIAPVGMADLDDDPNDAQFSPMMWTGDMPHKSSLRIRLAEADDISLLPASHMPSGYGQTNVMMNAAAAPATYAGTQGVTDVTSSWKWPEPIMLAAQAHLAGILEVENPLRNALAAMPGPGNKLIPDGAGGTITYPNWYSSRVYLRGPRYLQLRGARTAAG